MLAPMTIACSPARGAVRSDREEDCLVLVAMTFARSVTVDGGWGNCAGPARAVPSGFHHNRGSVFRPVIDVTLAPAKYAHTRHGRGNPDRRRGPGAWGQRRHAAPLGA